LIPGKIRIFYDIHKLNLSKSQLNNNKDNRKIYVYDENNN